MILKLIGFEADDVVCLAAAGQITEADFRNEDRNPLEAIVGSSWAGNRILLDMAEVTYVGTNGIGWLLRTDSGCRAKGGGLALYGLSPEVDRMIRMLRLDRVLTIAPDEAAARKALKIN